MKVLFDVVHPAHVHFFRPLMALLREEGHDTLVVARDKDVTQELLHRHGISHVTVGRSGRKGRARQAFELLHRDVAMLRLARHFRPDVILTRSPSGTHVARLVGATGVFDTDDGRAAGIHFRAAAPFAHVITTPDCLGEDYGPKHRRYPGYKSLAYLHPNRFQPDPNVRAELGVAADEPYAVVRFVAMVASHDRGVSGLPDAVKERLVDVLAARFRVFVSGEAALPARLRQRRLPTSADRMHDVLAGADVYVGDSQTMAGEAAVLGVPTLHCSGWSGRLDALVDLEQRYGLVRSFAPDQADDMLSLASEWSRRDDLRNEWGLRREKLLSEKTDVTQWYRDLLGSLVG